MKIKKITIITVQEEPVYDITVEDNHNFYAEGVLVHNCMEIQQPTDEDRTVTCNLASINLAVVNTREHASKVVPIAIRMLDNVIDVSSYPTEKARKTHHHTRSIMLSIIMLLKLQEH